MKIALRHALVVLALTGCSHPPRLDNEVANRHRGVVNAGTPTEHEYDLEGTIGDTKDDVYSLAKHANPGDTIDVKLGPGVYVLEKPLHVKGANLVIRGPGADRTRIRLDTDDWRGITVEGCETFELRGVTVAGNTGGGIDAKNVAKVVVNECDFAGSRYGLELQSCGTAYVDSCVFAGCEKAIKLQHTHLVIRGTSIVECWGSLEGNGRIEALGCVLAGNVDGANISVKEGTTFRSCLFGRLETFKTVGAPSVRSCLLFDDLYERFHLPADEDRNGLLRELDDFPDAIPDGVPRGCNMGAIQYALERSRSRGIASPNEHIRDILKAEARRYADAARRAVEAKDLGAARRLQQIALDYVQAVGDGDDEREPLRVRIAAIVH